MKSAEKKLLVLSLLLAVTGCIGYNPPHIWQGKPFTLFRGGDQLGRDQLANRWLVSSQKALLKGKHSNEVLSFLGQPQDIAVVERDISEDWFFVYYKNYKTRPTTQEGSFVVRMYNSRVLDIVNLS